ncbi:MAG: HEPN domain-containing protein [Candidatus Lokiarchaeota archaeon]|nr:HEPN domain-containing protein [Candidatus Lokiarchaeota archaeon]
MDTRRWFDKAEMFEVIASESIDKGRFDFASFTAQQAVEFYLKGILILKVGAKAYSHSLVELMESLSSTGVEVPRDIMNCIRDLGEHYLQARYPDARVAEYTEQEAREAIECMEVCLDFLRRVREDLT